MARKLKITENSKHTLQDLEYGETLKKVENKTQTLFALEYGEETSKTWKMRNAHCRTWIMVRKLTKKEIEKLTWQDLEFGKKN